MASVAQGEEWLSLGDSSLAVHLTTGPTEIERIQVEAGPATRSSSREATAWPDVIAALARWPDGTSSGRDWTRHPAFPRGGTPFQRAVWSALCGIGPGETVSYGELARRLSRPRAARAIGQAVGANPWAPLVPCHRVLAGDGSLGGYAGGGAIKAALLALEGIRPDGG